LDVSRALAELRCDRPVVLTIGAFDGVHRGHAFLFRQLGEQARARGGASAAITFDPDPGEVITGRPTEYLTSLDEKVALIGALGLDALCIVPFTPEVAGQTAAQFMDRICARVQVLELLVGHDFAMGHDRQGTRDVLASYCVAHGIAFYVSAALELEGQAVSASRIRRCLAEGDVEAASDLLGRNPSISGRVVSGERRGRSLGFPTANVQPGMPRALPADGIYVAYTNVAGARRPSAVNVGVNPTFASTGRTIESYILDFEGDLYGETASVEFLHRLRPEQRFPTIEALVQQMHRDIADARAYLSTLN